MTPLKPTKRHICDLCGYPQSTCLCAWVAPISSPLNIIILQHPKESKHAKNTVKLLALGIKNITVLQGESPDDWPQLVKNVQSQPQSYCLFYPHEFSHSFEEVSSFKQKQLRFPINHNVIFIDASWRKALKMWHVNPWLKNCSSWHFSSPPKNQYQIRATTIPTSLSTLESVAYVLEHTHHVDCSGLHTLFLKMQQKCFIDQNNGLKI